MTEPEPTPEARQAQQETTELVARIGRRLPFWHRRADQLADAVADNHFGDLLRSAMDPRRDRPGDNHA